MNRARTLIVIVAIAIAHAIFFIWYQHPVWNTTWDDQVGYQRLAHVLATTGKFTRYPDVQPFVPETIRTPLYPLFVAGVYRLARESHLAVAAVQALLFGGLTLVVFALARRIASERVALAAAAATALFPPFPYYGALVLTEFLSTLLVTAGMWAAVRAVQTDRRSAYALAGLFIGLATLTRPTYALLPVALAGFAGVAAAWRGAWRRVLPWGWTFVTLAIVLTPWFAYNYTYVHRITLSPAGGIGRATWEASWQGTWPGRLQAELTRLGDAYENAPVAELDAAVVHLAEANGVPSGPMLTYIHQWREIRRIWEAPTDPRERTLKRVEADEAYWRAGVANIRRDRLGHFVRRATVGTLVLWIAEIPIRYDHINDVPPWIIRLIWLVQAAALLLALGGLAVLAGRGRLAESAVLAALLAYVTAVHLPMLAEARYSLPAKPVVLVLAVIALAELAHRILPQTGDYLP